MYEWPGAIAWGGAGGPAGLGVMNPFNKEPATVGNGVMIALEAKTEQQVGRIHAVALAKGGTCEGPAWRWLLCRLLPGPRRQQAERLRHGRTCLIPMADRLTDAALGLA